MGKRVLPLGIALTVVLLLGFGYGFLASSRDLPPAGMVRAAANKLRHGGARPGAAHPGPDRDNRPTDRAPATDDFERLRSIGYLGAEEDAPPGSGVIVHDVDRADGSRLLYTTGHAPMAVLMERDGTALHTWQRSFHDAFPDVVLPEDHLPCDYFRKARLFDNGDLLVIFEGEALVKLDRDSRILWKKRNHAHHDFHVLPSGEILVLTREVHIDPEWNTRRPILEDFITVLAPDGEEIRRISVLQAVESSDYAGLLDYSPEWGDLLHTNTLDVVPDAVARTSPTFHAGSVLVSFNMTNVIGLVDPAEERLTWVLAGLTDGNHDPTFLENGNLLIFDNDGSEDGEHSRVLELDPFTQEVVWSYDGDEANGFHSWCCGANHRLKNGNTLITESAAGRAFEVTPENEIVWEFLNPYRDLENPELIGYIMEMLPVPAGQPLDWLDAE